MAADGTKRFFASAGLAVLAGVVCGVSAALFLFLLDRATEVRVAHEGLVFALPVAGLLLGTVYERWGARVKGGNNLVIDTVHDGGPHIPLRMAPLVLFGTIVTHLFGGSAGREGTAVQMGASLSDAIAHRVKVSARTRRDLLLAGIAGGFGAVFGTPFAGALFAMEVVTLGRIEFASLVPVLIAAAVGDWVTRHLGIVHTLYPHVSAPLFQASILWKLAVIGVASAAASAFFIELTHAIKRWSERAIPRLPFRMALGGLGVIVMWKVIGTSDYLGLGVPTILRAFSDPTLPNYAFLAKLTFTALTLGVGFIGGEVTPLFFVGAALGSVTARWLQMPIDLGAAVGLAAVFGASANAPLSLSLMVGELVGLEVVPYVLVATMIAHRMSGHRSIYPSQRIARTKPFSRAIGRTVVLRDFTGREGPTEK